MIDFDGAIQSAKDYVSLLNADQNLFRFEQNSVNNRQHSFCVDIYYKDSFIGHVFVDYWYGIINPHLTTSLTKLQEDCCK